GPCPRGAALHPSARRVARGEERAFGRSWPAPAPQNWGAPARHVITAPARRSPPGWLLPPAPGHPGAADPASLTVLPRVPFATAAAPGSAVDAPWLPSNPGCAPRPRG